MIGGVGLACGHDVYISLLIRLIYDWIRIKLAGNRTGRSEKRGEDKYGWKESVTHIEGLFEI
ncbi:MAG: hypothetical protein A2516_07375 [Alphaproteobacteria bacterium RIFOXYD12_FULL_60_8]|nr:MAG: hypothetical protein A2516_07375 [Alphaproteobacteria bacterium RIFOXYD12_FULL_60_8]